MRPKPIQTCLCSFGGQIYVSTYKWEDPATAFRQWTCRWNTYLSVPAKLRKSVTNPNHENNGWPRDAFVLKTDGDEAELDAHFTGWQYLTSGGCLDIGVGEYHRAPEMGPQTLTAF